MIKYIFKLPDDKLSKLCLNKLGIIIRKINTQDIVELTNDIFETKLSKKFVEMINLGVLTLTEKQFKIENLKDKKIFDKFLKFYNSLEKTEQKEILSLVYLKSSYHIKFNKTSIKKLLKKCYTIEINDERYYKYYSESQMKIIVIKLLSLSKFLSEENLIHVQIDVNSILDYDKIKLENFSNLAQLLLESSSYVDYNFDNLNDIINFLNKQSINFLCSFITSIDFLNNSQNLIENDIVNKVSFIERLIIKEKSTNIQEQFILKVGILCYNVDVFESIDDKVNLSKLLKGIYEIRSLIVHGNEKTLYEKIDHYKNIFQMNFKECNIYLNKIEIYMIVRLYLNIILKNIMIIYMKNSSLCEYIKNN